MVVHIFNLSSWETETDDKLCEFEVSLVYIGISRTAKAIL